VFNDPKWPAGLRNDVPGLLQQGYDLAKDMLQPAQYPQEPGKPSPLARATRMNEAAAHLRESGYPAAKNDLAHVNVSFSNHTNPAGVHQPQCTLCGD
jgi:cholesterol oxidase